MSLDNLLGISLEKIECKTTTIKRLLNAAERNIADAHITQISAENRFDAAYKAIILESAVGHGRVCGFQGAGQGATTRNSHSIPRSCNAVMRLEIRAICRLAWIHLTGEI